MLFKVYCQNIEDTSYHVKSGKLVVYHGLTESFVNKLPFFYDYLSDHEKSRAECFKHESDYNCYVSVHALLRIELSKLLGIKAKSIKIGVSEYGKPFIPGIDLPFNLSRTRNLFAFVVGHSNQYLGIDIEQIKPKIDFVNISRNYFSIKEHQLMLSYRNIADQKRTFFEIWTRKEALLKAIGVGMNTELSKVQVLEGGNILNLPGIQIINHVFKIATVRKKEALISIASSTDFIPEFKNLSFVLS
jgi:4'-phosphopantetheinyl transferase